MCRAKMVTTLVLIFSLFALAVWAQGPLTPPGAPGETMKSLTQVYDQATSAVQAASSAKFAAENAQDKRIPIYNPKFLLVMADSVYTIDEPGSYYLAENIIGRSDKIGIKITTSSVTLDLNGFSVIGVSNSKQGIYITAGSNHIIKNGIVRNWGLSGIQANSALTGQCIDVISASNGYIGFYLGADYKVTRCTGKGNINSGFYNESAGAVYTDCIATSNSWNGMTIAGGIAENCISSHNTANGINAANRSIIRSCNTYENKKNGIYAVTSKCLIENCTASENTENGIYVLSSNTEVRSNVCISNGYNTGGSGILVGSNSNTIEGNTVKENGFGIKVTAIGNLIVRNIARSNNTPFSIVAGNGSVPITSAETATNPWGNITY